MFSSFCPISFKNSLIVFSGIFPSGYTISAISFQEILPLLFLSKKANASLKFLSDNNSSLSAKALINSSYSILPVSFSSILSNKSSIYFSLKSLHTRPILEINVFFLIKKCLSPPDISMNICLAAFCSFCEEKFKAI